MIQQQSPQQSPIVAVNQPHKIIAQQQQQQQQPSKPVIMHQTIQQPLPQNKVVLGLHQTPQIMTASVASPPLKQPHLPQQQPIVTGMYHSRLVYLYDFLLPFRNFLNFSLEFLCGKFPGASSSRISVPSISPQGQQARAINMQQPGLPISAYEASLVSDQFMIDFLLSKKKYLLIDKQRLHTEFG